VWVVASRPGSADTVYAGAYGTGLYRSHDSGRTWERIGHSAGIEYVRSLAFSPQDADTAYVGTEPANLFVTIDGGDTWTNLDIRRLPEADSWSLPYSPRAGAVRDLALHPARPGLIYGALEVGGLLKSADRGSNWTITHDGVHIDVHGLAVHPDNPDLLYAATAGGVYQTADGAGRWRHLMEGYTRAIVLHPDNPMHLFAGPAGRVGHEGRILSSIDAGTTWTLAATGLDVPMEDMVESFVISPHLPNEILAVGSSGRVLVSPLNPVEWRPFDPHIDSVHSLDISLQ
jgi:photosystem II stability/assembly factor-like uncharacterized protein